MIISQTTGDGSIGAMVKRVLDMTLPKFVLAGLSMGGSVTIEFWHRVPE